MLGGGVLAVTLAAVIVLIASGAFTGKNATPSTTPSTAAVMSPDKLSSLLLSVPQLEEIMHTSGMKPGDIGSQLTSVAGTDKIDPASCLGSMYGSQLPLYSGSGYTAVSDQVVTGAQVNGISPLVEQTAVAFPSPDAARAFVTTTSNNWKACTGKSVTDTVKLADNTTAQPIWHPGDVKTDSNTITQLSTQEAGAGYSLQRAMAAFSNVVIDVTAYGINVSNEAAEVAAKMTANATAVASATSTGSATATVAATTTPGVATTTAEMTASDSRLLSLLPNGYTSANCQPAHPPNAGALASVDCQQNATAGGPTSAHFWLFPDLATLNKVFDGDTKQDSQLVPCPGGGADSPTTWQYKATPNINAGQIACGTYQNQPDVMWTREKDLMLGDTQGAKLDDLHQWWMTYG